jgi:hypothetical protein
MDVEYIDRLGYLPTKSQSWEKSPNQCHLRLGGAIAVSE